MWGQARGEVPGCIPMPHLLPWGGALHSQCCRMGSSQAGEKAWWGAGHRQEAAGGLWHWQWQHTDEAELHCGRLIGVWWKTSY